MNAETTSSITWFDALWATWNGDLYLSMVSCLLLALVAGLLLFVAQNLREMRKELRKAPLLAEDLAHQLLQARDAMAKLKEAALEVAPALEKRMQAAERVRLDLDFMSARAEKVVQQMEAGGVSAPAFASATNDGVKTSDHVADDERKVASRPVVSVAAAYGSKIQRLVKQNNDKVVAHANNHAAQSMRVQDTDPLPTESLESLLKMMQDESVTLVRPSVHEGSRPTVSEGSGETVLQRSPRRERAVSQAEMDLREKVRS